MTDLKKIVQEEAIAAISTAKGEGGIGLVRISGETALLIAQRVFTGFKTGKIEPRKVYYGHVVDSEGVKVDEVLLTLMAAPRSYTREDVIEITCHGGPAVVQKILELTLKNGARIARPGEFSKRAFLNGRIDLVQAEAIIDLIKARSEKGWKTAFSQVDGKLSKRLSDIESDLLTIITGIESDIDFPEEDFERDSIGAKIQEVKRVKQNVLELINSYSVGRLYREGVHMAIAGRPNVGKSSLMNALLERDRVIVTPEPGATRDTVEETLHIDGIAVNIVDTAGIRDTEDNVERLGVERTLRAVEEADIILLVLDGSCKLTEEDTRLIEKSIIKDRLDSLVTIINKTDLPPEIDLEKYPLLSENRIDVSAKSGEGIKQLKRMIAGKIGNSGQILDDGPVLTRERHTHQLRLMVDSLERGEAALKNGMSLEFVVADLADAKSALEELTGKSVTDQVIDKIFDEFCIGK